MVQDKWQRPVIQFRQALYSCNVSSLAPRILSILIRVVRTQWKPTLPSGIFRNIPKFEDRRGRNYLQNPMQLGIYTLELSSYVSNTARGGSVGLGLIRLSSGQRRLLLETIITTWQTQIVQRPQALVSKLYQPFIYICVRVCVYV